MLHFIHAFWAILGSEVSPILVTPELWPAPESQDSAFRLVTRVTHMSLGKWPALLGGTAITLDIRLPHPFRRPLAGWSASCASLLLASGSGDMAASVAFVLPFACRLSKV